jgi:hypothetical protein
MQWVLLVDTVGCSALQPSEAMPKRTTTYQYSIRFNIAQLDLVSRLMARTGLNLVNLIRFALTDLANKLGEPTRLPRAGEPPLGPAQQAAKRTIEEGTTDSDPELDVDF